MRISDWSSDVCSSDLLGVGTGEGQQHLAALALFLHRRGQPGVERDQVARTQLLRRPGEGPPAGHPFRPPARLPVRRDLTAGQLGSAPGRERGWQNVEISVVAATIKKNTKEKES